MSPKYTHPRPNLYASDEGFSVEVLGRTGLRYREGDRTIFIDSEVLATRTPAIGIGSWSITRWDAPNEGDSLTDKDRKRIVDNIRQALEAHGTELQDADKDRTF